MSKRFSLFYTGITAYLPGVYYSQLELLLQYQASETVSRDNLHVLEQQLQDLEPEHTTYISVARSLGESLKIEGFHYTDYKDWLVQFTKRMDKSYPITNIEHYYFLFGRKLAEIKECVNKVNCCILLMNNSPLLPELLNIIREEMHKADLILQKLTACATILSGEYRQIYFGTYYHFLLRHFDRVKLQDDKEEFSSEELNKLSVELDYFSAQLTNGFKKCIGMLKNLAI